MSYLGKILLSLLLMQNVLFAQELKPVQYEELLARLNQDGDKLKVVNFWATWCVPCVEEIPHFVDVLGAENMAAEVDVVFVSLDAVADKKKAESFIREHKMPGEQFLLDDVKRSNEWIPKVHPDWQGNIPVTAFYRGGKQLGFYPGKLDKDKLTEILNNLKQ